MQWVVYIWISDLDTKYVDYKVFQTEFSIWLDLAEYLRYLYI